MNATTRLLLPLIALVLHSSAAAAAIRPSFDLDSCSWRATHVVVVSEGEIIDGAVEVLESWAGDLKPGDTLAIPELAAFAPEKARTIAPAFRGKKPDQPALVSGARMILFLVKSEETGKTKWLAADAIYKTMQVSVVWIEGGMAYATILQKNPGPSEIRALEMTERELKRRVGRVSGTRIALAESIGRGDAAKLAAEVRTLLADDSDFIRWSVIDALGSAGPIALPSLRRALADDTFLKHHSSVLKAMAKAGRADAAPDLLAVLKDELKYWKEIGPGLKAGWWNGTRLEWQDVERHHDHYGRIMAALHGLQMLKYDESRDAVTATRDLWRSLSQLREIGNDQIGEACDAALKAFK